MFKLKSLPPLSLTLFACLSLVWGSCWGEGSYLPSLFSDPLLPLCLGATGPLRDWPLSPSNHTYTCTYAHRHTNMRAFFCVAGVATHCQTYKCHEHTHRLTTQTKGEVIFCALLYSQDEIMSCHCSCFPYFPSWETSMDHNNAGTGWKYSNLSQAINSIGR